jgi:hypothetical protein
MTLATTTVFLFMGMDAARCDTVEQNWPNSGTGGLIECIDHIETMAVHLERQWLAEFEALELSVVFDYEVTIPLGGWLYHNFDADPTDFAVQARALVVECQAADAHRMALWAENDRRLK